MNHKEINEIFKIYNKNENEYNVESEARKVHRQWSVIGPLE